MKKALYVFANIVVAVVLGWMLAHFVAGLSYEMPFWLDRAIRAGIGATGATSLDNTDDIETIAIIGIFAACVALVGLALAFFNWLVFRLAARLRASAR